MKQGKQIARAGLLAAILLLVTLATTFAADSGEIQLNTDSEGGWDEPAVAMDNSGNFVAVWQRNSAVYGDSYDVYARRYDSTGKPLGDEFIVNTTTYNLQRRPDVAMDSNGNFVVVWEGYDDSSLGIYGQLFTSAGTPVGSEFLVNTMTANQQDQPAVAMDGSGNFFVAYETRANGRLDIAGRRFANDGTAQGDEFLIQSGAHLSPDIAMTATGQAVVVWQNRDTYPYSISARRYDNGAAMDVSFLVSDTSGAQEPAVAVDASGNFTVVWEECCDSYQTSTGVRARRYDNMARAMGDAFWVNSTALSWQRQADIAMNDTGEFVVVWYGQLGGYETNIYAQYFLNDGTKLGPEFRLNERFDYLQVLPAVAMDNNGRFAAVWRSQTSSANGLLQTPVGIFGRALDGPPLANNAPQAVDDNYTLDEDTSLSVPPSGVLANDQDTNGDPLSAINITRLTSILETLTFNTDGSFTYVPYANYNGTRTFTYVAGDSTLDSDPATVTITVNPVPDAPIAHDDNFSISEDSSWTLNPSYNDSDPDGGYDPGSIDDLDPSSLTITSNSSHGTVANNGDGTVDYTPDPNYNGQDSFTYQICDGTDRCDTATASITINAVNDAPAAVNDAYAVGEDAVLSVNPPGVLGNDIDPDGDPLTASLETEADHGTLILDGDGSFTYTPDANYYGPDSFTYFASDGELTSNIAAVAINVEAVNDAPQAVDDVVTTDQGVAVDINLASNDTDVDGNLDPSTVTVTAGPDHGTVVNHGDGTVTYTPDADYYGSDSFVYRICDSGQLCAEATVAITINASNSAPVAADDSYAVDEDVVLDVTAPGVLSNDSDDHDALNPVLVDGGNVSNGSLALNADGSFTYTPAANYNGTDNFSYEVCDSAGLCDTATVNLTVNPVNDLPISNAGGPYSGGEGNPIALSGTASDIEDDPLSYTWSSDGPCTFSDPSVLNPTLNCTDDGEFTLTLTVYDGMAMTDSDTAVTVANVAPTADLTISNSAVDEGSSVTLTFSNEGDPSSDDTDAGFTYGYDCNGDGDFEASDISDNTYACSYADDGAFTPVARIADKDGGYSEYAAGVTVANVAPTIELIEAPTDPVAIDAQPVSIQVFFDDPGTADTHETTIDWGDGSNTYGDPSPISASHTYAAAGVYTLTVAVVDDDGASDNIVYEYVVIYDPGAGFVAGRGFINSDPAWCNLSEVCGGAGGIAQFGFVSRYNKGATAPTGRTDFNFRTSDLHFDSTSYNWLLVNQNGANAQFKGEGTINSALAPNGELYKFQIWAGEGTGANGEDTFRIKIWFEDGGTEYVVYDNGFDQPITNGKIKVQAH